MVEKEILGVETYRDDGKGDGVTELSLADVWGIFEVLLGGMGLAFIFALIGSFIWLKRRKLGDNPDWVTQCANRWCKISNLPRLARCLPSQLVKGFLLMNSEITKSSAC